jgi:hypothetical protein
VWAVRRLSDASWPSCRNPTVHIQGAIEQAEAGPAAADQVCMARDVAIMFDELRAIADRRPGRLQADVARLTTELDTGAAAVVAAARAVTAAGSWLFPHMTSFE